MGGIVHGGGQYRAGTCLRRSWCLRSWHPHHSRDGRDAEVGLGKWSRRPRLIERTSNE